MWEYVGAIGGWPSQQSTQNAPAGWFGNGQQNAASALYNSQAQSGYLSQLTGMNQQPMGVFSPELAAKECEGCGAPAVRYTHHCEYCKRPR